MDPHTTQDYGILGPKESDEEKQLDLTYHSNHGLRMPFEYLDPSLALVSKDDLFIRSFLIILFQCFLCSSEKEFGDLCNRFQQELIDSESSPLIELCPTRPDYLKDEATLDTCSGFALDDDHNLYSEDDEFEILE